MPRKIERSIERWKEVSKQDSACVCDLFARVFEMERRGGGEIERVRDGARERERTRARARKRQTDRHTDREADR